MSLVSDERVEEMLEKIEQMQAALYLAETVMMMVAPRNHAAEYRAALAAVQAALGKPEKIDDNLHQN